MSNISVNVRVQNNFTVSAKTIQLWHQFSSNPVQTNTWSNVPGNGNQTGYFVVNGSTSSGHDYWKIIVTLSNGSVWEHTSWKTCTIESADQNSFQTQLVSPGFWSIPLNSGGCTTSLSEVGAVVFEGEVLEPENKKAPIAAAKSAPAAYQAP